MSALELKKSHLGYVQRVLTDQLVNCIEGSGDFAINLNISVVILT